MKDQHMKDQLAAETTEEGRPTPAMQFFFTGHTCTLLLHESTIVKVLLVCLEIM